MKTFKMRNAKQFKNKTPKRRKTMSNIVGVILVTCSFALGITSTLVYASELPSVLAGINIDAVREITDEEAQTIKGEAWSPNGFPKGQCTWYVDGRVYKDGWKLKFTQSYGRNAYKWWDMVTNANKGQLGLHGDILVLNKWGSNPYGHVAYVESSTSGKKWNVTQANWKSGNPLKYIEGYPIYTGSFKKVATGKVNFNGGSSTYPLRGFLYKK